MTQQSLNYLTIQNAANFRVGVTLPWQEVESSFADIDGFFNISIPEDTAKPWKSSSGSINKDKDKAVVGAIAEAMERYSAALVKFPVRKLSELKRERIILHSEFSLFKDKQYEQPGFPFKKVDINNAYFGEVFSLYSNKSFWIPHELIGLGPKKGKAFFPSTSTGLAAHFNKTDALLIAIQELLERDALSTYWLNSLGGREIKIGDEYQNKVKSRDGEVYCFDITQEWNPHPVVVVCGYLKQRNKKRISLGAACRSTYDKAIEKAFSEWVQGTIFAGFYDLYHSNINLDKVENVDDFDKHAVYYTIYPKKWYDVPLIKKRMPYKPRVIGDNSKDTLKLVVNLLEKLSESRIRLFYRDITLADVRDVGLTVVRVLSPELSLIHGDERTPFLGGRASDVKWRYPDLINYSEFPNKYPHPLG